MDHLLHHANLALSMLMNLPHQDKLVQPVASHQQSLSLSVAHAQEEIIEQWRKARKFHHWIKHGQAENKQKAEDPIQRGSLQAQSISSRPRFPLVAMLES